MDKSSQLEGDGGSKAGTGDENTKPKPRVTMDVKVQIDKPQKLRYPLGVLFIVLYGFCAKFSYSGIKASVILYISRGLNFNDDDSTNIYHLIFTLCVFTPLLGAILGDSRVGKFKTILIFTVVYIVGSVLLAVTATSDLNLPKTELSIVSLVLLAIGTGFVKPCIVAMGGDQFKLPEQEGQLQSYFSLFYFAVSLGSLLGLLVIPIIRFQSEGVSMLGVDGDLGNLPFFLPFSVSSAVFTFGLIAFVVGKIFYAKEGQDSEGNIIVEIFKCIAHALGVKWKTYREGRLTHFSRKGHWMDYAVGKYEREVVEEIKTVLRVLVLYLPLPMFWALMEQQGSRWILQAARMDRNIYGLTLIPEHVQVINPLLVLALIPFFDKIVYPLLGKFNLLTRPLEKLATGGILAAAAFLMSGFVELSLEASSNMSKFPAHQNLTNISELVMEKKLDNPESLHVLWILPQYITITVAEVIFAVTGMEFSYSYAPATMKSVMQSAWLLTTSSGHLIVAIVAKLHVFPAQSSRYFLFAILMFIDITIFTWMAKSFEAKSSNVPQPGQTPESSSKSFREMRTASLYNRLDKRPTFTKDPGTSTSTVP